MKTKTSKQNSKLNEFFGRLAPNTPVKKLVAFILVFAVLAGGYYAYRSFAAVSTVKTYYADDFMPETRSTRAANPSRSNLTSTISLVGPDTNNRARITANTQEQYTNLQKTCFHYKVSEQSGNPDTAAVAVAVYDKANPSQALSAKSIRSTSSSTYKQLCLEYDAGGSKTLQFAVSVWDGAAVFSKATIEKGYSITIKAKDFPSYTSRMTDTRTITQSSGSKAGEKVVEMYKPNSQLLFWLKNTTLNSKLKVTKGKKYEACITYSIGDKGSASDLTSYYPVGLSKVDQQNYNTTKSLNTYSTKCHSFTYTEGNADSVSLHYPFWAQNLSSPYKIRIASVKISQQ